MLIRFVAKNIYSFKEETEFNLFPNQAEGLPHHKVRRGDFEFLRFGAIYGANGAGKSNLIRSIAFLDALVKRGKLPPETDNLKFKLNDKNAKLPVSLGIEFMVDRIAYFYTLTFDGNTILHEYLAESRRTEDVLIFERTSENEIQTVEFYKAYYKTDREKLFAELLADKLIDKNELLITFLSKKYAEEFRSIGMAFDWFDKTLVIMQPDVKTIGLANLPDKEDATKNFVNKFIHSLNTGISEIDVKRKKFDEMPGNDDAQLKKQIEENIKNDPSGILTVKNKTGEEFTLVNENDEIIIKRLITKHQTVSGKDVDFTLAHESDGTKRLIEYIPAFRQIIESDTVLIVDEIERSIHPMTIKEIMKKLMLDERIKGQLIFSTHESGFLDQNILRPDEIWFAQKDTDGSGRMYSLSDFKIHNTVNIENGYLNGRFGGIPFLGNLKDLNW